MSGLDIGGSTAAAQSASLTATTTALSAKSKSPEQIKKSAQDFEAVFATEMLTPMFEGVEVDQTFGGGHGEEMFRTMLLDQYGKQMARDDSLGLARQIGNNLLSIQEGKH